MRPGVVSPEWAGGVFRAAVPLAILAGCQTLTMLTGGIDLSVGADRLACRGSSSRRWSAAMGLAVGHRHRARRGGAGRRFVNGIGVGVFQVHPLIMTLGMSLVVLGLANVWQLQRGPDRRRRPAEFRTLGSDRVPAILPYSLIVFVPLAALILLGLRRTGYGRLLYAIGDNPIAARLSGARRGRSWSSCTSSRRSWPASPGS